MTSKFAKTYLRKKIYVTIKPSVSHCNRIFERTKVAAVHEMQNVTQASDYVM